MVSSKYTERPQNGLGEIRQIDGTRGDPDRAEIRHESLQKGRGGKPLLHILNGDASAAVLRQSNLEGHLLPRREALIDGPAPRVATDDEWISIRTEHLAGEW